MDPEQEWLPCGDGEFRGKISGFLKFSTTLCLDAEVLVTLDCLSLGEEATIQQIMVVPGREKKDCRRVKKKVQP